MIIKQVTIQLRPPNGRPNDYGLVALGNYTLEGNVLTMVNDDGKPLRHKGAIIKRTLADGEVPEVIAKKLTADIARRADRTDDFNRPIYYPTGGWR